MPLIIGAAMRDISCEPVPRPSSIGIRLKFGQREQACLHYVRFALGFTYVVASFQPYQHQPVREPAVPIEI